MAPSPSTSRRQSNQKFRSKFSVSYEALLAGEHPWQGISGSSSSSSLTTSPTPLGSSYSNASSSYFSSSGKKPSAPRIRFYADILCLKVEPNTLDEMVHNVSARMLVDDDEGSMGARIRDNIGSLWRECLRVWSDVGRNNQEDEFSSEFGSGASGSDEVRRTNAIDTLLVLSRSILAKKALTQSTTSLDLIWIFAGGIDEADDVFEALINAIEEGLRGELDNVTFQKRQRRPTRLPSSDHQQHYQHHDNPISNELPTLEELLRHRIKAVHLAIIWISQISSTNLAAYFVRRDLFVAACSLLSTIQSIRGNINNKTAHGHPGLAEADDLLLRKVVRDVTLLIGLLAGSGQEASTSNSGGSGASFPIGSKSHSLYFQRLCDWVDSGSMSLLRDSVTFEFEQAWRAYEADDSPFAAITTTKGLAWGTTLSLNVVTEGAKRLGLNRNDSGMIEASNTSTVTLPPSCACSLLSIYLLARTNQAFVQIALAPPLSQGKRGEEERGEDVKKSFITFPSSLLSLSSYLLTHGSLSERSKSYSRLSLLIFLALLSSTAGASAIVNSERKGDLDLIHQCQQKSGPKPARNIGVLDSSTADGGVTSYLSRLSFSGHFNSIQKPTRILPYILDSCVQYLRYNMRKKLDVAGYLICLEVIKLAIDNCAEQRILLEYSDWIEVWRSIQSVIAFVVGRHTELRSTDIGILGKGLLSTLGFALLESDKFLQSKEQVNVLLYELVRSSETLRRMACIAVTGKDPADPIHEASMTSEDAEKIIDGIPGWRLIDMVLLSFEERLADWKQKKGTKGNFSFAFSVSSLTGGYFGGETFSNGASSSPNSSSTTSPAITSSVDMPDVAMVMSLIASLDLERLVSVVNGIESSKAGVKKTNRTSLLDEEWLERAESQCISEAFRCASEDMRKVISEY